MSTDAVASEGGADDDDDAAALLTVPKATVLVAIDTTTGSSPLAILSKNLQQRRRRRRRRLPSLSVSRPPWSESTSMTAEKFACLTSIKSQLGLSWLASSSTLSQDEDRKRLVTVDLGSWPQGLLKKSGLRRGIRRVRAGGQNGGAIEIVGRAGTVGMM